MVIIPLPLISSGSSVIRLQINVELKVPVATTSSPQIGLTSAWQIHRQEVTGPQLSEAAHFSKCEVCGGYFDTRDLAQVFDHEGPLPHPACDQVQ
jgi:hypothetical protein